MISINIEQHIADVKDRDTHVSIKYAHYLSSMGIQSWILRKPLKIIDTGIAGAESKSHDTLTRLAIGREGCVDDESSMGWDSLEEAVSKCTRCALSQNRNQTVLGVGDHDAQWMLVGEAPGAEEDQRGEPFVGRAGQLLNNMLAAIGLSRDAVYITNVVKCRPPGNRDPRPDEVTACGDYLKRQIDLIHPRLILALGRFAAQTLLSTDTPVGQLRGKVHYYAETVPLIVTYHPAYLLRSPDQKAHAWDDLKLARAQIETVP